MSWTVGEKRGYRGMVVLPRTRDADPTVTVPPDARSEPQKAASKCDDEAGRRFALVQPLIGVEPVVPSPEPGVEVDPVAAPLQAEADVGREQNLHAAAKVAGEAAFRLDLGE